MIVSEVQDYFPEDRMPKWLEDSGFFADLPANILAPETFLVHEEGSNGYQPLKCMIDPLGMYLVTAKEDGRCYDLTHSTEVRYMQILDNSSPNFNTPESRSAASFASLVKQGFSITYGEEVFPKSVLYLVAKSVEKAQYWVKWLKRLVNTTRLINPSFTLLVTREYYKLSGIAKCVGSLSVRHVLDSLRCGKNDRKFIEQLEKLNLIDAGKPSCINLKNFNLPFYILFLAAFEKGSLMTLIRSFMLKGQPSISYENFKLFIENDQADQSIQTYYEDAAMIFKQCNTKDAYLSGTQLTNDGVINYIFSEHMSAVEATYSKSTQDMTLPMTYYLINSSHNTYLTGRQIYANSSVEMYRHCLNSGCRCVELDCWDGSEGEPIVTHGKAMCTHVSFRDCLVAIKETAFAVSPYPVILSLENHCSLSQQLRIAAHLEEVFGDSLLSEPLMEFPLKPGVLFPSPEELKGKILVKNKKLNQQTEARLLKKLRHPEAHSDTQVSGTVVGKPSSFDPAYYSMIDDDCHESNAYSIGEFPYKTREKEMVPVSSQTVEGHEEMEKYGSIGSKKASPVSSKASNKNNNGSYFKDAYDPDKGTFDTKCETEISEEGRVGPQSPENKERSSSMSKFKTQMPTIGLSNKPKKKVLPPVSAISALASDQKAFRSLDTGSIQKSENNEKEKDKKKDKKNKKQVRPELSKITIGNPTNFRVVDLDVSLDEAISGKDVYKKVEPEDAVCRTSTDNTAASKDMSCKKLADHVVPVEDACSVDASATTKTAVTCDFSRTSIASAMGLAMESEIEKEDRARIPDTCQLLSIEGEVWDDEDPSEEEDDETVLMEEQTDKGEKDAVEKPIRTFKVHPFLSVLVNYMMPARISITNKIKLDNQQEEYYLKVSSLNENSAERHIKEFQTTIVAYTHRTMIRVYPKAKRIDSSNYFPHIYWNAGCQMAALNFQTSDTPLQLNSAVFEANNRCGYLLKPLFMRENTRYNPHEPKTSCTKRCVNFKINIISAMYLVDSSRSELHCIIETFGRQSDLRSKKVKAIENSDNFVQFDSNKISIESIQMLDHTYIRFAVMEKNIVHGQRILPMKNLKKGYRYIPLKNAANQQLPLAILRLHIDMALSAAMNDESK